MSSNPSFVDPYEGEETASESVMEVVPTLTNYTETENSEVVSERYDQFTGGFTPQPSSSDTLMRPAESSFVQEDDEEEEEEDDVLIAVCEIMSA